MKTNYSQYRKGLEPHLALGLFAPCSGRVLLRAITMDEINADSGLFLGTVAQQAREAAVFEVVALADDVPVSCGFGPGDHVVHVSAAVDVVDAANASTSKYLVCMWGDIIGRVTDTSGTKVLAVLSPIQS